MSFVEGLRCRECGRAFPAEALHVCDWCFGPLEVTYDYEAIAAATTRESIAAGPTRSGGTPTCCPRSTTGPSTWVPASPPWCGPTASRPISDWASCGSRTTPSTPPARSRTGWWRWPWPGPGPWASRSRPARPPATWPTRWPPTRPGRACATWSSSPPTSSRARWSPAPSTGPTWWPSTAATTTSTACARSWRRSAPRGRSSTSTCAPTTPRGRRRSPSRRRNSWDGRCPTTSSSRWRRDRS